MFTRWCARFAHRYIKKIAKQSSKSSSGKDKHDMDPGWCHDSSQELLAYVQRQEQIGINTVSLCRALLVKIGYLFIFIYDVYFLQDKV